MAAPRTVQQLVERYRDHRISYISPGYKEAQLRQEFIDSLLRALGWDVGNEAGYAEAYKDIVSEDALKFGGTTKAPDYSVRIGGQRKFFVEVKKPALDIQQESDAAYQLRRYGWSAKLPLSVLTNFEWLAVYDCRVRPKKDDKASVARTLLLHYADYIARWDELSSHFSREAVLKGSFDKFADAVKLKRGTMQVDDAFLQEIEAWREQLAVVIAKENAGITQRELNSIVQRTIDRIIFLRICEDRGIETYGTLRRAAGQGDVYPALLNLFKKAEARYNSGLFYFKKEKGRDEDLDGLATTLRVSDAALRDITSSLYYPESPYEFSVLSTEILGQVYERFLGKVITLEGKKAKVTYKPDVRKKGGVYYTPDYIVDYIVSTTLGQLVKGKNPTQVARIRILDPACGSGSFLLGAYRYLLEWHRSWYIEDGPSKHSKGKSLRLRQSSRPGGGWILTSAEKKRILLSQIFGVDVDSQAVEVTKLSLLLKVLEEESSETVDAQLKLFHERALPDLARNIRCGNSLVSTDLLQRPEAADLSDDDIFRINPMSWPEEFSQVLVSETGGFDVILGNPPYSYRKATEDKLRPYYKSCYQTAEGNFELYKFFIERALSLLSEGGTLGFIVSASFLVQPSFEKLRRLLTTKTTILKLCPLGPGVFQEATVDTCILITRWQAPTAGHSASIGLPTVPRMLSKTDPYSVRQARFAENPAAAIDCRLTDAGARIVSRLFAAHPPIEAQYEFGVGINTGFIRDELVADRRVDRRYHRMVPGSGISRYGAVRTVGWIMYDSAFVQQQGKRGRTLPEERFLSSDKILVVRTRNLSLKRRIIATLDRSGAYNLNRLSNIIARPGADLAALLAVLNSGLFQWLFSTRFFDYEIKPVYLRTCPLPKDLPAHLGQQANTMLGLNAALEQAKTEQERANIKRRVAALDVQIDDMVSIAYGIKDSERNMIQQQAELFGQARTGTDTDGEEADQEDEEEEL